MGWEPEYTEVTLILSVKRLCNGSACNDLGGMRELSRRRDVYAHLGTSSTDFGSGNYMDA